MALGLIILASVTGFFKTGMTTSQVVAQRAEMQQDVRAAINLVAQDVSMAGAGMPTGGVALPYGAGNSGSSHFAVDQTGTAWLPSDNYLGGLLGTPAVPVTNFMYSLIPNPGKGMQFGVPAVVAATGRAADAITVIYVDYSTFGQQLPQYQVTFPSATSIALTAPVPAPVPAFFAVDDPAVGIKVGDLILLTNNKNGSVVAEVTGITPGGGAITFADKDPLNMNQPGAKSGNVQAVSAGGTVAYHVYAVTYFIDATGPQTRLMRQVNGQVPVPVADNIIALNFTYDTCDGNTSGASLATCANISDPIANGYTPNNIHKVNISVMGQSLSGQQAQNMELVTSVSTRDINFKDRYK
jgi:hypothetical protein